MPRWDEPRNIERPIQSPPLSKPLSANGGGLGDTSPSTHHQLRKDLFASAKLFNLPRLPAA